MSKFKMNYTRTPRAYGSHRENLSFIPQITNFRHRTVKGRIKSAFTWMERNHKDYVDANHLAFNASLRWGLWRPPLLPGGGRDTTKQLKTLENMYPEVLEEAKRLKGEQS